MCGIAGSWARQSAPADQLTDTARAMAEALQHRGPDDQGVWLDETAGLSFGHRRLAVVDLTPTGAQPMTSRDDRFVLSYNGEIYDHRRLRGRLVAEGVRFRGTSDTEVLLEGLARWGVEDTLASVDGMFAFALWDRRLRALTLARDRMGEKPLYVGWAGQTLLFASELRAMHAHPAFRPEVDRAAVEQLLRYSCIPAPASVYVGIQKLRPGHLLVIDEQTRPGELPVKPYWDLAQVAADGLQRVRAGDAGTIDELDGLLSGSVRNQLLADVPVGCFLSGGVDSSLVAAIAQEHTSRPLQTFTIGFDEAGYDEAPFARAVAERLGTDHVEHYVSHAEALGVVPNLASVYDEPFADSSQIPTVLVSQAASKAVTVALTGDGGDELFAGYDRYRIHGRLSAVVEHVPLRARRAAAAAALAVPTARWDRALSTATPVLPRRVRGLSRGGEKVHKLARVLQHASTADLYESLMSTWQHPRSVLQHEGPPRGVSSTSLPGADAVRVLQFLDQRSYLPDDLLVKVDRAAMSVSLETRVPMLSAPVVAHSWAMPTAALVANGRGKAPLRELLSRRIPLELVDRPKQGFGVPLGAWLRGSLREWAHDLLTPAALQRSGLFRPAPVIELLGDHVAGRADHSARLWPVLMFQAWYDAWW